MFRALLALNLWLAVAGEAPAQEAAPTMKLMTFNIRYGTARDGDYVWPNRQEAVAAQIGEQAADVLAIQEALDFQLEYLEAEPAAGLEGYRRLGQHREGGDRGEFSGLYVNTKTTQVLEWGEMWLSPVPEQVASKGWDAALPRMAVWADVQSRAGGPVVRVYGTHYDHRGAEARLGSSRLLAADSLNCSAAVIMGDFNATMNQAPMQALVRAGFAAAVDRLRPELELGTFNGFRDASGGRRIDHIFCRGIEAISADILGGAFVSDHYAVIAELDLRLP